MGGLPVQVDTEGLGEPARTLVEKISEAISGIARPWQIRRVARAKADEITILAQAEIAAEVIRAAGQMEITEVQRRAMARFFVEEGMRQENIETITRKALPNVNKDAKPEEMENDWIVHFFDRSRLTSDEDMQVLWARVLAGQANAPGGYSKRTVDILATMEKADAVLFTKLCGFAIRIDGTYPLVYDTHHELYASQGITFDNLAHLEALGVIRFDHLAGFVRRGLGHEGYVDYFGTPLWIGFEKPENNELDVGKVLLTPPGRQLATVCSPEPVDGFANYLREKWKRLGYRVEPGEAGGDAS